MRKDKRRPSNGKDDNPPIKKTRKQLAAIVNDLKAQVATNKEKQQNEQIAACIASATNEKSTNDRRMTIRDVAPSGKYQVAAQQIQNILKRGRDESNKG